jgi:hypothetical protein
LRLLAWSFDRLRTNGVGTLRSVRENHVARKNTSTIRT